jgi:hypothetical protein
MSLFKNRPIHFFVKINTSFLPWRKDVVENAFAFVIKKLIKNDPKNSPNLVTLVGDIPLELQSMLLLSDST